jgi:PAS domain S-box-containing protein
VSDLEDPSAQPPDAPGSDDDVAEAYEHGPAGYVSTRPDGTIVRANTTFLEWTGYSRPELENKRRIQDLLSIAGRIYYETHLGPLMSMQGSLREIAVDVVRRDRSVLPAIINASRKRAESGEARFYRFTIVDATDRRRYERQLLAARRTAEQAIGAKSELLATLSHDIRTPLGSVMAVAALLERTALDKVQTEAVRILKSSVSSILSLVDGILTEGRDSAVEGKVDREFDPRALFTDLVGNLEPLARDKGIALHSVIDERLPNTVLGDPIMLVQIMNNLVGNAVKFTEAGSVTVDVSVGHAGRDDVTVCVRVIDTGIGIAPEAVPRIFEAYGQADDGIAARFGGTGLGLAISRRLLRARGSELHVESTPGKGSEFRFELSLGVP